MPTTVKPSILPAVKLSTLFTTARHNVVFTALRECGKDYLRSWCHNCPPTPDESTTENATDDWLQSSSHVVLTAELVKKIEDLGYELLPHATGGVSRDEYNRVLQAYGANEQALINTLGPALGFPTGPFEQVCRTCLGGPCTNRTHCEQQCLSAPYTARELAATLVAELTRLRAKLKEPDLKEDGLSTSVNQQRNTCL